MLRIRSATNLRVTLYFMWGNLVQCSEELDTASQVGRVDRLVSLRIGGWEVDLTWYKDVPDPGGWVDGIVAIQEDLYTSSQTA